MHRLVKAYLFEGTTVVINKSDIKNAKDKNFEEVTLILSDDFIKENYNEIMKVSQQEENEEE